ncbi:MAG: ammonium transporter [Gammaproteobacteria bacterium]|nr:ammonium transporter [Gammaproteobacteria bacterium]
MQDLIQTNYAIDTFYFLVMGVLVMFMACGFSMLESGMVRAKNTAEILTKNVSLYAIACIMYMLLGYQLMYLDTDPGSVLPSLGFLLQPEHTAEEVLASGGEIYYSNRSDYFFQVVFVATAMSIVSGAVAERMRLWAFLGFAVVMTAVIYPVSGMWTWGGGWLSEAGYSDFAGAGVVHLCGGAAALAGVLIVGPRAGKYEQDGRINAIPGCNMPLATLGMFVLWFGWFGFNGGSELRLSNVDEANAVARVFVNTNLAACGGLVAALVLARLWFGKADLTMALNGALAGLVSITAEPLAGSAPWCMMVGMIGGLLVVVSIVALDILRIDDPVGAISVHGVCGIWGIIAVVFSKADATLAGQLLGIVGIFGWVFLASLAVWGALNAIMGIRVSEEDEEVGLDLSETGLEAYPDFTPA